MKRCGTNEGAEEVRTEAPLNRFLSLSAVCTHAAIPSRHCRVPSRTQHDQSYRARQYGRSLMLSDYVHIVHVFSLPMGSSRMSCHLRFGDTVLRSPACNVYLWPTIATEYHVDRCASPSCQQCCHFSTCHHQTPDMIAGLLVYSPRATLSSLPAKHTEHSYHAQACAHRERRQLALLCLPCLLRLLSLAITSSLPRQCD